jgi:transposase
LLLERYEKMKQELDFDILTDEELADLKKRATLPTVKQLIENLEVARERIAELEEDVQYLHQDAAGADI